MPSSSGRVAPAAAHVFVADLDQPALSDGDLHHLGRVLRLRDGETVTATDGHGRWRSCRWRSGALEVDGEIVATDRAEPAIAVGFALTKGAKPEWVVQKLTEIGVDAILPFTADHSVVRWDESKAAAQLGRWREVARLAAMQSRRTRLPDIAPVAGFAEVSQRSGAALAHPGGGPLTLATPVVLVGPEGGFSPGELARDTPRVDLGWTVLRAETAALAAGIRLATLREG